MVNHRTVWAAAAAAILSAATLRADTLAEAHPVGTPEAPSSLIRPGTPREGDREMGIVRRSLGLVGVLAVLRPGRDGAGSDLAFSGSGGSASGSLSASRGVLSRGSGSHGGVGPRPARGHTPAVSFSGGGGSGGAAGPRSVRLGGKSGRGGGPRSVRSGGGGSSGITAARSSGPGPRPFSGGVRSVVRRGGDDGDGGGKARTLSRESFSGLKPKKGKKNKSHD